MAAEQEYAVAQVRTAQFHQYGLHGIEKNLTEAERLYKSAAVQGNLEAQHALGDLYREGCDEIKKDEKQAARFYTLAANQGHPLSLVKLGNAYEHGLGVRKSEQRAIKFYWEVWERHRYWERYSGETYSAHIGFVMARCFEHGIGTAKNEKAAAQIYKKIIDHAMTQPEDRTKALEKYDALTLATGVTSFNDAKDDFIPEPELILFGDSYYADLLNQSLPKNARSGDVGAQVGLVGSTKIISRILLLAQLSYRKKKLFSYMS